MLSQNRRDFRAIYVCEHCKAQYESYGYDDANFHEKVIPKMECGKCGGTSPEDYEAQETRYPEDFQI